MHLNRSFAFLRYPEAGSNTNPDDNYLNNADAATKVVQSLGKMGVKYFLVIAGRWETIEDYRTIAAAIQAAGLQFFSNERWSWEDAINEQDHFDAAKYLENRVKRLLIPLKLEFPSTFIGFHFKDEPGLAHLDGLGELKACLSNQPEFQGMKVFLNLLPIHANYEALSGLAPNSGDSRPPSAFGVDCSSDSIKNREMAREMVQGYGMYARRATEKVRPDYLSFDLYPFLGDLAHCKAARELTVSENLSVVSLMGQLASITPVAYLQNVQLKNDFYANFHHLRWFVSWALAFGIQEFANFISHNSLIDDNGLCDIGLLDARNDETKLASDLLSVFGFLRHIQYELSTFQYRRLVAPFLGVESGDIVGWLPSPDVLAGEYFSDNPTQAMVFFARHSIEGTVQTTMGLSKWFDKIEQLNVSTGQWDLIARSLNSINISLNDFPGALYRLTKSEGV